MHREVLLIASGVMGMLLSAFADSIGLGHPGFGMAQLSGLVISALLAVAGLVNLFLPNTQILVRFLTGIYIIAILYVGLRPYSSKCAQYKVLLDFDSFGWHDFAINTVGFIPFGYLLMLSFGNRQKDQRVDLFKRAVIIVGLGGLISLFLEVSQYYLILGRQSSLFDWISDTFGALLGIAAYLVLSRGYGRI